MNRYETFVIRLWVEGGAGLDHGEITHVLSGTGLRFRQVQDAARFMEQFVERPAEAEAPGGSSNGSAEPSPDV